MNRLVGILVEMKSNKYEPTTQGNDGEHTVNYFNSTSVVASTTGNYSGIYDMSGGSWEYVMGVMLDSTNTLSCSGRNAEQNSGFHGPYCYASGTKTDGVSFPNDTKYYDIYSNATVDERFDRRILGDATGEMGPFGNKTYGLKQAKLDHGFLTNLGLSMRITLGSIVGVFSFANYTGAANGSAFMYGSFRIVLSI